jgi:oligopeptide/dipeptide ABC transporter ATP-binding protein
MEDILKIQDLKTYFFTEEGVFKAVDGVTLRIGKGQVIGLIGESGCGKSVTALSILRLISNPPGRITDGTILFQGKNLLSLPEKEMRKVRGKEISMIFQDPMTALNPVKTIGNQIAEVFRIHYEEERAEALDRAIEMMRKVEIPSAIDRAGDYPHQFSGGMLQRIMVAIALACRPSLLIADEATSALDVTIQSQILELMKGLQKEYQTSILVITHDFGVVAELCQRVAVMYAGHIIEEADIYTLFDSPLHPYTQGLLESISKLGRKRERLYTIPGVVPRLVDLPPGCIFSSRCHSSMERCRQAFPTYYEVKPGHKVSCHLYSS